MIVTIPPGCPSRRDVPTNTEKVPIPMLAHYFLRTSYVDTGIPNGLSIPTNSRRVERTPTIVRRIHNREFA